jgi:RNA 2',3'-cyclic 3'-phosphodiesterase
VSSPVRLQSDERLRLFLALRLPDPVRDNVVTWQEGALGGAGRIVPRAHLHITLAFLGARPAAELAQILRALEEAVRQSHAFELEVDRYRETRSVAMLVLRDSSGHAVALAGDVQERLESLGVYRREGRPWLPHLTVVRFRERPRLRPTLPSLGRFAPSDAAAFLSRLHPSGARYEVLQTFPLHE